MMPVANDDYDKNDESGTDERKDNWKVSNSE
jgi:hypothetical protein